MEQEKCFSVYFQKLFFNKVTEKDNVFASVSYNREKRKIRLTEGCEDKCTHEQSILVGEVEFKIRMEYYPEYGAVGWKTTVTNCSRTKSGKLSDIAILDFNIPLPAGEKMIHKGISGDVCGSESFFPFENSVACGESVFVKPKGGKSSNTSFPFFDLCSENDGLIFGIGWTGVWFYKIKRQESSVSVKAGLPEADFYLEAQESLDLPSILVMAYEGGNREAHNRFRRLIRDHYSPKIRFGDEMKMPFSLQTFDRYTYTVPSWNTEESQLQTMEYANRCGNTDTFWMDALWFTGGFPAGVGNYTFREGFPEGFKNISQILHKEGKRLMVWFEPERVVGGTQMSREHPELLMEYVLPPAKWVNNQETRLLDFSNPQVVDWIIDQISDFIRTYQIDIYRQDCNINPAPFWEASDMEGRKGITEIRYINGLYRFWDTLLERFPHLMIDMVAGGGNRIDLETSARCVYAWRSDTGCAPDSKEWKSSLWNQNQTMGLSDYVVYHGIAAWKPQAYDVRSAIANGFAANFDVFDENCDFEMLKVVLEEYGRLRRYWEDDFYPLTEADLQEDHWTGYQFGKESCGVMMLFRREKNGQAHKTFHFYGLNAEKNYRLVITDENYQSMEVTVIGKELLEGYEFTIENPRNSLTAEYPEL